MKTLVRDNMIVLMSVGDLADTYVCSWVGHAQISSAMLFASRNKWDM